MDTMGILTETTAAQLEERANDSIIGFNAKFIEEAFKFIMCSNDGNIEVFYNGNLSALIIKSGRLYALVLPVKVKDDVEK